jgi:UDP-N-acetylmuramoyl-tripeptide--D-alanyl-D-alanine ligase
MPVFHPEQLARWAGGTWTKLPVIPVTGFVMDSRIIRPGELFIALRTERRDGHDFLAAAKAAGAAGAIVSRQVTDVDLPQLVVEHPLAAFQAIGRSHRQTFGGRVIGITGSCGKTSTKELLALLLGGEGEGVLATEGNLNNHLGVPLTLTRIDPAAHRVAIVEAGISGPGEMEVLASMIEPDLVVTTLVAPAHLQELGGLEGVAQEKARLSACLKATGMAVFPRQCADFGAFRNLGVNRMVLQPADVLRPSEPPQDVVYFTTTHREDISVVALAYGKPPPLAFTFRRVSQGMAQNAALAICSALWLGVSPECIQERLKSWSPAHWRGELVRDAGRLFYLDFYNANPASMQDAIESFVSVSQEGAPRLFVLGCMEELGSDAAAFHRDLGRRLRLRDGDHAYVIGGQAAQVLEGLAEAGHAPGQAEVCATADEISTRVASWPGSVFVKGSRRYQLEKALAGVPSIGTAAH